MSKVAVMLGLVGALSSCKREAPPPPPPQTAAITVDAGPSAAPSASAAADVDPDQPLKEIAKEWNDAINARDMTALAALHAPNVKFYGLMVDDATYCSKMKAALAKDPSFHQDISAIRVDWPEKTKAKVSFRKKDDKAEHPAYLVLEKSGGSWKIAEESDLVTDANLKCMNSSDELTLTGTIDEGSFIWHNDVMSTTVLVLAKPICVVRSGSDEWGDGAFDRMDGVDRITLEDGKPKLPIGTRVRVKGSHVQPHLGSGHYSTTLLLVPESVTKLP